MYPHFFAMHSHSPWLLAIMSVPVHCLSGSLGPMLLRIQSQVLVSQCKWAHAFPSSGKVYCSIQATFVTASSSGLKQHCFGYWKICYTTAVPSVAAVHCLQQPAAQWLVVFEFGFHSPGDSPPAGDCGPKVPEQRRCLISGHPNGCWRPIRGPAGCRGALPWLSPCLT